MKLESLISILTTAKEKLGNVDVVFQHGLHEGIGGGRQFDVGEQWRQQYNIATPYSNGTPFTPNYNVCISYSEVNVHVDGFGRYILNIFRSPYPLLTEENTVGGNPQQIKNTKLLYFRADADLLAYSRP